MDAIKDEGLVLLEILNILHEHARYLRIMQSRIVVVDSMVSIVPAILIVNIVDAVEGAAEVPLRITLIHKAMLCPVAHHHDKTGIEHGNDKNHERRLEIDEAHQYAKQNKREFTDCKPGVNFLLLAVEEIHKGIYDAKQ